MVSVLRVGETNNKLTTKTFSTNNYNFFYLDCSGIAGSYDNGKVNISYDKDNLQVLVRNGSRFLHVWLSQNKSETIFYGEVKASCEGRLKIPDVVSRFSKIPRIAAFVFNERTNTLILHDSRNKSIWRKGQTFTFIKYAVVYFILFSMVKRWKSCKSFALASFLAFTTFNGHL